MKLQQKFRTAEQFNLPDTTIIIASYPARNDRSIKEIDAVASYTDHFARSFKKEMGKQNRKVIVLAQKTGKDEWYTEGDMLICRVWDKGSPLCFAQILTALAFFPQVTSLLVQFEFHQFGGKVTTALFPAWLTILKIMRKTVSLVLHQVVEDIGTLSGHLNVTPDSIQTRIYNTALHLFYRTVASVTPTIIVHNHVFAKRFEQMTGRTDAIVIPHGLGAIKPKYSKSQARKTLGYTKSDYVILTFGFLTWYKGSDWITDAVAGTKRKHMQLLLAGGVSPNIKNSPYYRTFVGNIKQQASNHSNIKLTGFVEDADIPRMFAAADLVVLPYRSLMSSSGPLAMTLAFKKPFLMSHALSPYTKDADFTRALHESGLTANDITFRLRKADFWKRVTTVQNHPKRFKKLSAHLGTQRVWPLVANRFVQTIKNAGLEPSGKFAILQGSTATYAHT